MSPRPYLPDMTPSQIQSWVKEQLEHLPRMARALGKPSRQTSPRPLGKTVTACR